MVDHTYLDISGSCSDLCVGVPALFPLHTLTTLEDSKALFLSHVLLALNLSATTTRDEIKFFKRPKLLQSNQNILWEYILCMLTHFGP